MGVKAETSTGTVSSQSIAATADRHAIAMSCTASMFDQLGHPARPSISCHARASTSSGFGQRSAATTDALRSGERQIRALRDAKADISQHASPDFDKLGRRATELRVRADALRARSEGAFRDLALARIESEVAAAERQLRLTRIGIARTTDRVADAHTGDSP